MLLGTLIGFALGVCALRHVGGSQLQLGGSRQNHLGPPTLPSSPNCFSKDISKPEVQCLAATSLNFLGPGEFLFLLAQTRFSSVIRKTEFQCLVANPHDCGLRAFLFLLELKSSTQTETWNQMCCVYCHQCPCKRRICIATCYAGWAGHDSSELWPSGDSLCQGLCKQHVFFVRHPFLYL